MNKRSIAKLAFSWRGSLFTRVLTLSIVLFALMIGGVVLNSSRIIKEAIVENLQVSEQQKSQILNLAVAPYALSGDFDTLKIFIDELLGWENDKSGLIYLVIGREDGELLLQSGSLSPPIPQPDTPETYLAAIDRGIVHIRRPLLLKNNDVGFIQYGLSFKLMALATARMNQQTTLLTIVGMTLITAILLSIMLRIVRRINVMGKISLDIAQGDYSHRVPESGRDEISLLATNFNSMAAAIQQRVLEITQLNQELESRVEARTQDLVALNTTLKQTIDDLKWTQENLIRSEKLAGLGALVAGVAHELNTPLGNAVTVATTLQDHIRVVNEEFKTALRRSTLEKFLTDAAVAGDLIVRNLQRAADLVTSFKHVSVDQTSENRRVFDLCTTIEEIVATLSPMLKKTHYQLELDIPPGITMDSYPGALGQTLTNLINNAVFHAFAGREQGHMRLKAVPLDDRQIQLEFSDDGSGMNAETLKRIYDPFFTTRFGQGGSGLGMSIVHNLVCSLLGGSIDIRSAPGSGTCFILMLPLNVNDTHPPQN